MPDAIERIDYDSTNITYRRLQAAHEKHPQYQDWRNLPDGVKKFVTDSYCNVRKSVFKGDPSFEVGEILNDIYTLSHGATQELIVWRGLGHKKIIDPKWDLANSEVNDTLEHIVPTSTSTNPAIALDFAERRILMKITIPERTQIIVYNRAEMEVLIRQGFDLRIDRIDLDVPVYKRDRIIYGLKKVIQATVLPG